MRGGGGYFQTGLGGGMSSGYGIQSGYGSSHSRRSIPGPSFPSSVVPGNQPRVKRGTCTVWGAGWESTGITFFKDF